MTSSSKFAGGSVMRMESLMSEIKSSVLIDSMRRKERKVAGLAGGGEVSREVRMRKWSDGVAGEQVTAGLSFESVGVITRSRVLFLSWVGKVTCCLRPWEERRSRN